MQDSIRFCSLLVNKVGRAPAAFNFADDTDTGRDTDQLLAPKWRQIVLCQMQKLLVFSS